MAPPGYPNIVVTFSANKASITATLPETNVSDFCFSVSFISNVFMF